MPFTYRRRVRLTPSSWLNIGRRGVSASARAGRVTASTSGRWSVRLFRGLSWRSK